MKYTVLKFAALSFTLVCLPFKVYSWNAVGHMVIANIAYQQLQSNVRATVDTLVKQMNQDYASFASFADMATWPDSLKAQKIDTYSHWHYIDIAFSTDGTPLKNTVDTDNAVWATNEIEAVVKNTHANPNERARFLSFLVHIAADLHQPLHTVSYFSSLHLDGDRGGNDYYVKFDKHSINLHSLWDGGVGVFDEDTSPEHINTLAKTLMALYPASFFKSQIDNLVPDDWVKEGTLNAKTYVYSAAEKQDVTTAYVEAGQRVSQQEAALAGYRLASLLNQLLDKG